MDYDPRMDYDAMLRTVAIKIKRWKAKETFSTIRYRLKREYVKNIADVEFDTTN